MGARKDQSTSYSRLTQEEVDAFCIQWGIDLRFNQESSGLDKSIDQCPAGSVALYCRNFEFSNLCYSFSTFVLNVLEYYRVSFGQLHPQGLARVLHFEILRRAAGYDPSLLAFRHFFRLAKNGNWFTFETSQVDTCLISSMRHPDAILNDLEPSDSESDNRFLKSIRACPFPEPLLVLMGISKLWDKPDRDLVLMRDGQVMSALDFSKSDDTSDVVFADAASAEGEDAVVRGSENRFEGSDYVSVPADGKKGELTLVVGKDTKALGKKVGGLKSLGKAIEGSSNVDSGEIYVPDWKVTASNSFKSHAVCEDVLNHFAPPPPPAAVRASSSSMVDDRMISKMIMAFCNLCALLHKGIARFRKRMQEYEVFSKKREAMKANMEGFAEKEKAWQKKVHELTQRHEVESWRLPWVNWPDNKWLIEHGFQQVVTYLLHSSEFNSALGDVYLKLLIHGRHQGYTAGYDAGPVGTTEDKSSLFQPGAFEVFTDAVVKMERLTYPYMGEVSECYGKPLFVLQG
ncbi:hypothetical protein HanXRQr2_Chr07g0309321 [Helianthus annuus]|uniref:Transposase (putative) gypsy type domain-containing protein n=1 Tax=Helianthus annuus TaxID=4232 RepID=A0A9K3IMZ0_HELAN|nr:hypothetical protein HanXRQr2_Chr07g0309321 [Helianthus annuus]KAJ0564220.1 hypothetical protein HanHA89_Chr07g0271851 [Helianthus annuus]